MAASISLSRKAASYCTSPRPRSQATMSIGCPTPFGDLCQLFRRRDYRNRALTAISARRRTTETGERVVAATGDAECPLLLQADIRRYAHRLPLCADSVPRARQGILKLVAARLSAA